MSVWNSLPKFFFSAKKEWNNEKGKHVLNANFDILDKANSLDFSIDFGVKKKKLISHDNNLQIKALSSRPS